MVSYATPMMRELAQTTQQANQLVVFDRGSVVVIAQQEAPGYWGISIRVGSHVSLFDTGSGHVLLAFRPHEERRMMIAENVRSSEKPAMSPEFFARLDQIRDRGYEMMASTQTAGVFNLSAPVLGPDGAGAGRADGALYPSRQPSRSPRCRDHRDDDQGYRPPAVAARRSRRRRPLDGAVSDRRPHMRLAAVERDQQNGRQPERRLHQRRLEAEADQDRRELGQAYRTGHRAEEGATTADQHGATDDHRGDGLEQVGLADIAA